MDSHLNRFFANIFSLALMSSLMSAQVVISNSNATGTQAAEVTFKIVSGGAGNTTGVINSVPGSDALRGTVSFTVGQIIQTEQDSMLIGQGPGGPIKVELGFWNIFKRRPENIALNATYDFFPNKVVLDWNYDPNTPQATSAGTGHDIYRASTRIQDNYNFVNTSYDDDAGLIPGTEYTYTVKGSNVFGTDTDGDTFIGKTSSNGTITGFVETALGTKIPFTKVRATPNWGSSIMLDGNDDYASFPANSIFDLASNNTRDSLTAELWFNTPDVKTQVLLSKGSNWKLSLKKVGSYNYLNYTQGSADITSVATIPTSEWTHVAIVKKGNTAEKGVYRFYVNGSKILFNTNQDSLIAPLTTANSDPLLMGKDGSGNNFRGNIDEFRMWSGLRDDYLGIRHNVIKGEPVLPNIDSTSITKYYNVYTPYRVSGSIAEPNLLLYNNMDVGTGNLITNAVDQALKGTLNGESDNSYWDNSIAPAYATDYTDLGGAYTIVNINYGSGKNMSVSPTKPYHVFSPTSNQAYLSDANPVRNNVNFKVTNLQSISGFVYYDSDNTKDAECGVAGVKLLQNGKFLGTVTDADGSYLIEVEPGGNIEIIPDMPDRDSTDYSAVGSFNPHSFSFTNVVQPQTANFKDTFKRTLVGQVSGGLCQLPLGPQNFARVILKSSVSCFIDTAYVDGGGKYKFDDIPTMEYQLVVDVLTDGQYSPAVPNLLAIGTEFQNGGKTHNMKDAFNPLDSTWATLTTDTVDFTYYAPLSAEITDGFNKNLLGDNQFTQNKRDTIDIEVYEQYYLNEQCPLNTGWVKVRDYLGDRYKGVESDTLQFELNEKGKLRYPLLPGLPNTSASGANPYKKKFEVLASDTSEQRQTTINEWAVVLGNKPVSVDFTTTAPEIPFLILRQPPGDNSSSTFTSESSSSFSLGFSFGKSAGFANETSISSGVKTTTLIAPFGIGTSFDVDAEISFSTTTSMGGSKTSSSETTWEFATSESFSTAGSDIFVGGALNILYGTTDILSIKQDANGKNIYSVDRDFIFIPNGFATTFQYSKSYIQSYLIPELKSLVVADSSKQKDVDRWNEILAYSDSLAKVATFVENRSFDGSAGSFTKSETATTSSSHTFETEMEINTELAIGLGIEVMGLGIGNTSTVGIGMSVGSSRSSSTSNSTTIEYTLDDDDSGDDYTVNIKTDPVYGTPAFDVVAGNSSCPYEEWTNAEGVVVTNPQDEPFMQFQSASTATNVLPDGTAEYRVLLRNESVSQTTRTYVLSVVSSSNPRGAEILLNGQSGNIPYTLDYNETDTVTVTVRRPIDSDFYEFEDLRLKFAPECESNYAGVTNGYQASFTANFARPCSVVDFYNIAEDWVLNNSFNDTLAVTFAGFDLSQSYFDEIELQYSPLSESNWYTIDEATIIVDTLRLDNRQYETTYWSLANLDDGVYDLRFKSVCLSGALVNLLPPKRGTVDRIKPSLLGSAEPVDKVLNQNDEIAFNFTEEVDPVSVEKINFKINDPYGVGEITAFDLSSNENRVVSEFLLANRDIENHEVTVEFYGYSDLYGNVGDTVRHAFKVNRNPISWSAPEVSTTAIIGTPTKQTISLNNIGSNEKAFNITGLPDWLTVNTSEGTLNPGGNWDIVFTISPDINVGDFVDTVFAETPDGNEPLALKVASMCEYPNWPLDKLSYQYSMNIVAKIAVLGTFSKDKYDRIAAIVDGEYRGFADLEYDPDLNEYRAYLTAYSNSANGETVEFHIWDRTNCIEWWATDKKLAFTSDGSYGEPNIPININATGEVAQQFKFSQGWDWMSFNLESSVMSLESIFEDLRPSFGDRIVNQNGFAQYAENTGWIGNLTLNPLDKKDMFMVNLAEKDSINFVGIRVGADTIPIELNEGWSWISYLPNFNIDIASGLETLTPTENDLIKSQTQFAQYVDDVGWVGNLKRLYPGEGYKIQLSESDTLTYPYITSGESAKLGKVKSQQYEAPWDTIIWQKFQHSMNIIALVENKEDWGINNPNDVVIAMKDNEIRGYAKPEFIESMGFYRIFMTLYSDVMSGESIELKFWDSDNDIIYKGSDQISFSINDIVGNIAEPWVVRLEPLNRWDKGYIPDTYVLDQNYPNPFNPITRIGFGVPEDATVSLKIYNILGKEVRTLVNNQFMEAGYKNIVWNARNENGERVPTGIYFVLMNSGSFMQSKKMVLLK